MTNEIDVNKWFYDGDVNPECGGIVYRRLDNDTIETYYVGEFSPYNFCLFICSLIVNNDYTEHDSLLDDYYCGEFAFESYSDFKLMKSIDWQYTNISDKSLIDKFVRCDFNIWNEIKRYIEIPLSTEIYTSNRVK